MRYVYFKTIPFEILSWVCLLVNYHLCKMLDNWVISRQLIITGSGLNSMQKKEKCACKSQRFVWNALILINSFFFHSDIVFSTRQIKWATSFVFKPVFYESLIHYTEREKKYEYIYILCVNVSGKAIHARVLHYIIYSHVFKVQ